MADLMQIADDMQEAAQRARLAMWPRECGCAPEVIRCAHVAPNDCTGEMYVKLIDEGDGFYRIELDCCEREGYPHRHYAGLAGAQAQFEAQEKAMRHMLERIS